MKSGLLTWRTKTGYYEIQALNTKHVVACAKKSFDCSNMGESALKCHMRGRKIEGGMSSFLVESQLVGLARKWLSEQHVMCPGLVDFEGQNSEEELSYIPKNVSRIFRHGIFCTLLYMSFCDCFVKNVSSHR